MPVCCLCCCRVLKQEESGANVVGVGTRCRHPEVAATAKKVSEQWRALGVAAAGPAKKAPGAQAAAAPSAKTSPGAPQQQQPGPGEARAGGGAAGLRKPAAAELPHLVALGRKSSQPSKPAGMPAPAAAAGGGGTGGTVLEGGTPRAPTGGPVPLSQLRRLSSEDSQGLGAAAPSPRGAAAPLRTMLSGSASARAARPLSAGKQRTSCDSCAHGRQGLSQLGVRLHMLGRPGAIWLAGAARRLPTGLLPPPSPATANAPCLCFYR